MVWWLTLNTSRLILKLWRLTMRPRRFPLYFFTLRLAMEPWRLAMEPWRLAMRVHPIAVKALPG
jgi:hypothetical protein